MVDVYVLECEGGRIYVGKTDNGERRLKQHITGQGAKWTKKYKPKRIIDYYRGMSDRDEKKITEKMIKKYGASKVRGGPYVKTKMTKTEIKNLEKKVGFGNKPVRKSRKKSSTSYRCGRCGREGHNRNQCYAKSTADGVSITTKSWKYRPQNKLSSYYGKRRSVRNKNSSNYWR